MERLQSEVLSLRKALAAGEMEEEGHVNTLLRTVSTLRKEKVDISAGMERETECLLHRLSRDIRQAQRERDEAVQRSRDSNAAWQQAMEAALRAEGLPPDAQGRLLAAVAAVHQSQQRRLEGTG